MLVIIERLNEFRSKRIRCTEKKRNYWYRILANVQVGSKITDYVDGK